MSGTILLSWKFKKATGELKKVPYIALTCACTHPCCYGMNQKVVFVAGFCCPGSRVSDTTIFALFGSA